MRCVPLIPKRNSCPATKTTQSWKHVVQLYYSTLYARTSLWPTIMRRTFCIVHFSATSRVTSICRPNPKLRRTNPTSTHLLLRRKWPQRRSMPKIMMMGPSGATSRHPDSLCMRGCPATRHPTISAVFAGMRLISVLYSYIIYIYSLYDLMRVASSEIPWCSIYVTGVLVVVSTRCTKVSYVCVHKCICRKHLRRGTYV